MGWWSDGRAIVHLNYKSPEVGAWETQNKTFTKTTDGVETDVCLVDIDTGQALNLTVVERVSPLNTALAPWPADPLRALFLASVDGKRRPFTMDLDGRNKREVTSGGENFIYGIVPSPDGKRIAYLDNYKLYFADPDGSNARRVDTDPAHDFQFVPAWSPDGQWLLFLAGEHYNCHPYVMRADGTGLRKLADRGGHRGPIELLDYPDFHSGSSDRPVWSKDSKWVYYTAKVGEALELMRVSLTGQVEQLTHSHPGVDEALTVVKAVRDRYDGRHRNPYDEVECGHHYARAMASFAVLLALTGYEPDMPNLRLRFAPRLNAGNFATFFSTGSGWGLYRQRLAARASMHELDVRYGNVRLQRLSLERPMARKVVASAGGQAASAMIEKTDRGIEIVLAEPVTIQPGAPLRVKLG